MRVAPDVAHWKRLSAVLTGTDEPSLDELLAAVPVDQALEPTSEDGRRRRSVRPALESLQSARGRVVFRYPYGEPSNGAILVARHGLKGARRGYRPVTEDEEASYTSDQPITLQDHTVHVVARVEQFTAALGITDPLADDLRLAAELHDTGKADERFQLMLAGGDPWNRQEEQEAL